MVEFEVVTANGFLGEQLLAAGDTRKYAARLEGLLDKGEIVTAVTATVTSPASTVSVPVLWDTAKAFTFFVTAALLDETFTLALRLTTSAGQTLNYTCVYHVHGTVVQSTAPNPLPLLIGPTGPTGPHG